MANTDRPKQQYSEAPQRQQSGQQSGMRDEGQNVRGGSQTFERGSRNLPSQRGTYYPASYGSAQGPFAMMRRLSDEMDRIFESFGLGMSPALRDDFGGGQRGVGGLKSLWSPHIELFERDNKLVIQADLPGISREDLNVDIEQDAVVIHGERRSETSNEDRGYYHSEVSYGSFHRVIPLPEGVDTEQAKAVFRDGVLRVELPAPQAKQRGRRLTIEDQTGSTSARAGGAQGPGAKQQG